MSGTGPVGAPEAQDAEDGRGEVNRLVLRGLGWMAASQVTLQLLALASSIALARLLSPRDFGLAGEALVFTSLALVLVDFGIASAVIQKAHLSERDRSTAFWMSVVLGSLLTVVGVGLSWPIASLYHEPEVQPLFAVLSLNFLFTSLGIVQGGLLMREMRFRSLEIRNVIAAGVSLVVAVALAAGGAGPWAIIGQDLAIVGVSTALLWRSSSWRPRPLFSVPSARSLLPFSSQVFGAQTLAWAGTNVDNLLIGRFLGAASLGAYTMAFSVMLTPASRIAGPLTNVFFPAFSRIREPRQIAELWLRAVPLVGALAVPLMLGLMAVAPDFIAAVFGPQWHAAATVVVILAPVGLVQALSGVNVGILQATGRTATLLRFTALHTASTVAGIVVGLHWGLDGVAVGYLVGSLALEPWYLHLTARSVGVSPRAWLAALRGVFAAGLVMLAVVLLARHLLLSTSLAVGVRLAVLVLVGAAVYIPLLWLLAPGVVREVRQFVAGRRAAGRGVAA